MQLVIADGYIQVCIFVITDLR